MAGWASKIKITIHNEKVEATLTDFPVMISITDEDLKTARPDGYDFKFTSSDGITQLSHEIDKWDIVTGEFIAWVKVPSLSSVSDTILYLYYGNPVSPDQQDIPGTWDSNFKMVQHLKDDPDNAHTKDSTINVNNGIKKGPDEPLEVDGIIGKAQSFDSVNDYISVLHDSSLQLSEWTISAWIKASSLVVNMSIISKGHHVTDYRNYQLAIIAETFYGTYEDATGTDAIPVKSVILTPDERYRVVFTYKNRVSMLYVAGLKVDEKPQTIDPKITQTSNLYAGSYSNLDWYFNGLIDEARISNIARSPEWIKTGFNSQSDPATFFSWEKVILAISLAQII